MKKAIVLVLVLAVVLGVSFVVANAVQVSATNTGNGDDTPPGGAEQCSSSCSAIANQDCSSSCSSQFPDGGLGYTGCYTSCFVDAYNECFNSCLNPIHGPDQNVPADIGYFSFM